jgi:hypothetical protein
MAVDFVVSFVREADSGTRSCLVVQDSVAVKDAVVVGLWSQSSPSPDSCNDSPAPIAFVRGHATRKLLWR